MLSDFVPYSNVIRNRIKSGIDKVYLFFDVKNFFKSFYVYKTIENVLKENSNLDKFITTIPLQVILSSLSKYKEMLLSDGVSNYEIIFFDNDGFSSFHQQIYKDYKSNRIISSLIYYGNEYLIENVDNLSEKDKERIVFGKIFRQNLASAYYLLNKIKNTYFIQLKNLESDFVPYFLINYYFSGRDDNLYIIFSSDHDMFQVLIKDNIFQLFKDKKGLIRCLNKDNVVDYFFYSNKLNNISIFDAKKKIGSEFFPMIYSLSGDRIDNIPGLKGIGLNFSVKLILDKEFDYIFGNINDVVERLINGKSIFSSEFDVDKLDGDGLWYKKVFSINDVSSVNKTISDSYKLFSFEYISRWLNERDTLNKREWYKQITSVLESKNDNEYLKGKDIFQILKEFGTVYLDERDCIILES